MLFDNLRIILKLLERKLNASSASAESDFDIKVKIK